MKHFLNTQQWSRVELDAVLTQAAIFKRGKPRNDMQGKSIALLFFDPAIDTRVSVELGAWQLGGRALVLQPGRDAWPIEFDFGAVMDGQEEAHVAEVAQVLGRQVDLIGICAFPKLIDWRQERKDEILRGFAKYSPVPVINLETITRPCQELAHTLALLERFGDAGLRGKKYLLTWTYHPRPLSSAVANSALTIATRLGMNVTLLCPTPEYALDERYLGWAADNVAESGGSLNLSHDIDSAYQGADVVYAKSWGALPYCGRWDEEARIRHRYRHFIVDERKMGLTNNALFSHCLPFRRNVEASDAVVDSRNCLAIDEAANRLHVYKAVMAMLLRQ